MLVEAEITSRTNGEISYIELLEDMGTAVAGGAGEPGGLGVPADAPQANKGGVSGYDPRMGGVLTRNKPNNMIGAVEIFNVSPEEFNLFKMTKYYPKTKTGNYLRRFGHRNAGSKIAVRNEDGGEVFWLPAANKKSFIEEYGLEGLDILFEENIGKTNLKKSGESQYRGIAHFLDNHINVGHAPGKSDSISIKQNSTGIVTDTNINDFRKTMADMLIGHHEKTHDIDTFQITTPRGIVDVNAPHVSSKNPNDLTITDSITKKEINVDMKGGRGRWQFQDEIDTPSKAGRVPSKEFKKIVKGSPSFVAFHDQSGNIEHIDTSDLANTRKMLSSFYYKRGSSKRPGKFILPGEVNVSLSDTGKKKAAKRNVTRGGSMVPKSAQQEFPKTMGNILGTQFGKNDMYTSMLRKKAL
jgi:hypothetical protein